MYFTDFTRNKQHLLLMQIYTNTQYKDKVTERIAIIKYA